MFCPVTKNLVPWEALILKAISYLSPNLFWFYREIAKSIVRRCDCAVKIVEANCDPLDDLLLQHGQVDIAFICGLPLIRHNRISEQPMQILAAPVMLGDRYQNQPIYFADIVVHAHSKLARFEDLEGTRFCYNDRGSNSGYSLLRYRLLQHLQANCLDSSQYKFFKNVQQSGSHQQSLQWIADGIADCAAIDSVVMEAEIRQVPELALSLRVIDSIPSPMPPIAVGAHLDPDLITQLRNVLLDPDQELQAAMALAQVRNYVQVTASNYEQIAIAYDVAMQYGYEAIA